MKKLLIATTNPAKLKEIKLILGELIPQVDLVSLKDLKINTDVEEKGTTFEENAIVKARTYAEVSGIPAIADDGGLEIDALNGEPGVKSRYWAGYRMSDEEMIKMTLDKLKGVPREKRGAQLKSVMALVEPQKNRIHTFNAVIRGFILEKPAPIRVPGYPFRALFYIPEIGKAFGELSIEEETRIGHRRKALRKGRDILRAVTLSSS